MTKAKIIWCVKPDFTCRIICLIWLFYMQVEIAKDSCTQTLTVVPIKVWKPRRQRNHVHSSVICIQWDFNMVFRADSRFAPSQWETVLLSSNVFNWLGASLDSAWYWKSLCNHYEKRPSYEWIFNEDRCVRLKDLHMYLENHECQPELDGCDIK